MYIVAIFDQIQLQVHGIKKVSYFKLLIYICTPARPDSILVYFCCHYLSG